MSAEFTFIQSTEEIEEPLEVGTVDSITFTIQNTGDVTGTTLGFYLRQASNDGSFDFPSTDSPAINLVDILKQGDDGYGITITQGLTTTRFQNGTGDRYENRIPLSIGTGADSDQIESSATVEVTIDLEFAPGTSAKTFYVDIVLE